MRSFRRSCGRTASQRAERGSLTPAGGQVRTLCEKPSRPRLDALQAQPQADQAPADRGLEHTRRSLEVSPERVEPVADGGLAADLVIQHSSCTSNSLDFEHFDAEKLTIKSLDVKRFDLE